MVTNLIHLGDKVDIRFVQQVARVEQTGVSPRIYKSQVNDIKEDGSLEMHNADRKWKSRIASAWRPL